MELAVRLELRRQVPKPSYVAAIGNAISQAYQPVRDIRNERSRIDGKPSPGERDKISALIAARL
jgi:hypothetical protein